MFYHTMDHFLISLHVNDVRTATYCYNEIPINDRVFPFINVLSRKNVNMIMSLLPLTPSSMEIIESAIWYDNQEVLTRLFLDEYRYNENLTNIAATKNNVAAMTFLHQRGCILSEKVLITAIMSRSLECIKYIIEIANVKTDHYIFSLAAKRPSCRYYSVPPKMDISLYNGLELKMLQYLHDKGCPGDWDCNYKDRHCHFCMNRTDIQLSELWYMYETEYKNLTQWLPREILDDVIGLI